MAITNYGELKVAVANWLARSDLTARVPELVTLGESRLYAELRVRFMEATTSVVVTANTRNTALPTNWVQGRAVYIEGPPAKRLEYRTPVEYWAIHANRPVGQPDVFTIVGDEFLWGPSPGGTGYTAKAVYYKRPDPLTVDSATNGVFTLAPNLLLYASLIEASPFLGNDARVAVWTTLYEDLLAKVQAADSRDRYSGDVRTANTEAQRT